jgi:hypothetical protein
MAVMVAFAIVVTLALGVGAGYLAILGVLRLFGHRASASSSSAMTFSSTAMQSSGD